MSRALTTEIEEKSLKVFETARSLAITDDATFQRAGEGLKVIKTLQSEVNATFDPVVASAHEAHKQAIAAKNQHLKPLLEAEALLKTKIRNYTVEIERQRREAEQKAEAERLRIEELQRQAQLKAEQERKKAEEEMLRKAIEAEAQGKTEEAEAILAAPLPGPPKPIEVPIVRTVITPPPPPPPKVQGVSTRKVWKWRLVDFSLVPDEYKQLADSVVTAKVRSQKGDTKIPGIEVYEETEVAGRI